MSSVHSISASQAANTYVNKPKNNYSGTITGAAVSTIPVTCAIYAMSKKIPGAGKSLALALPMYIIPGIIVDYLNNKQRENSEPNAKTDKGNDYVKVNMGKKWGAVLGLVASGVSALANPKVLKLIPGNKVFSAITSAIAVALMALGGYGLGAIADNFSNKQARKEVDKQA